MLDVRDGDPDRMMDERVTFYVSIGNSDDRLTQSQWSNFVADVGIIVRTFAETVHGQWLSSSDSRWQNACWCFEAGTREVFSMRQHLRVAGHRYCQESIAWAMCPSTELLEPLSLTPGELKAEAGHV